MTQASQEQVLVVDDDPGIREAVRAILEHEGYTVLEAPDGVQGLALLARSKDCLVALVDYRMPRMDGYHLLQAATAAEDHRCQAYIMITANRDLISPTVQQLLATKHIPLIDKPFDIDTLLVTIEQARDQMERPATKGSVSTSLS